MPTKLPDRLASLKRPAEVSKVETPSTRGTPHRDRAYDGLLRPLAIGVGLGEATASSHENVAPFGVPMSAGESARQEAERLRANAARLHAEADRWSAGADGEQRVAAVLDSLERATTRVLHDRLYKPGTSQANIDHLVVTPAGIHLIDAKNWVGTATVHDGSLWQHWTAADGSHSACRNDELDKVRAMAAHVQHIVGRPVTPVLCLASPTQRDVPPNAFVRGVHLVPVDHLAAWLAARPAVLTQPDLATVAVRLSVDFPPAAGDPLRDELRRAPSVMAGRPAQRRLQQPGSKPMKSPRRRRTAPPTATRLAVVIVMLLALVTLGPRLARTISGGVQHALTPTVSTATTSPSPVSVPAAQPPTAALARALQDWSIRAKLYRDNAAMSVLTYVPDASLGAYSDRCLTTEEQLVPLRRGLLHSPDTALSAAATRYDKATHAYLEACRRNRPAALHQAAGAISAAASDANTRYNRLLGHDPTLYDALRVL
ncbi:MAG: nuclease-related domain-containing protein [Jatrophihabitans sp.]|uniref:nuclease-related domain-containing protein n=1 Tax=Jatrophihabitans sp. TaxID=1932789 RepID=UPI003F81A260